MSQVIYQVDAFTCEPFGGNPAAVCVLDKPRDVEWMQAVAGEMNLSETAFLVARADGYDLRWFTPTVEVALCGHATLASARVLFEIHQVPGDGPISFHTRSGVLTARRVGDRIEMDFPAEPATACDTPDGLAEAMGATLEFVGQNRTDKLLTVSSEDVLRSLNPDLRKLRELPVRGCIVTAPSSDPRFDFVSRYFAPAAGVDEDPVTGSAHCCTGPFWSERLGKSEMTAFQASRRGGVVHVRVEGDRVMLSGSAVMVMKAELYC